jgi:hypothetical protein
MDSLKKKIATLPKLGHWHEETLSLLEDPTVEHTIQYRNPLDVIQALWSNPTYVDQMVFAPRRLWSSHDRSSRLYNEMWTGDWWWETQVSIYIPKLYFQTLI